MPEVTRDNEPLRRVLYAGPMMAFYERFLGGEVRHFDFTWFRVVAPGLATPPHTDAVYMNRGTQNLFTSWTPIGGRFAADGWPDGFGKIASPPETARKLLNERRRCFL